MFSEMVTIAFLCFITLQLYYSRKSNHFIHSPFAHRSVILQHADFGGINGGINDYHNAKCLLSAVYANLRGAVNILCSHIFGVGEHIVVVGDKNV